MNRLQKTRFKNDICSMACILVVTVLLVYSSQVEASSPIKKPILSASEISYPPFCFVGKDGKANGFSNELLRAALKAMGRDAIFRVGPWTEVKSWLSEGAVQALPLVGRTPEREAVFDFTFPYISLHGAIVVRRENNSIQNINDLRGRQVAVMKGDNAEEYLRRVERGINIQPRATFETALKELSNGSHDAVVIQRLVALRLIEKAGLLNLKIINRPLEGFRQDFCFAVQEGDRDTLAVLNEGLSIVIADGTYRRLHTKWFAAIDLPSLGHMVVGGDHNYPPYEFLDQNGRAAGYNVDLTRAIAQKLGFEIKIQLDEWRKIRKGLENGEIDAIHGMFFSAKRDLTFDFTAPHTIIHHVAVVREGSGDPPATLPDLTGKDIVVMAGDIMHDYALENGFADQVSVVATQEDALRELAQGSHDCALIARIPALYWIKMNGWENLKVGQRPLLAPEYCYAVPENRKALLSQFSEGLRMLEESGEYRSIYDKWLGVYDESAPDIFTILKYSAFILVPLILIVFGFFFWSWSLRKQVAQRTKELQDAQLRQNETVKAGNVGLWDWDLDTNKVHYSAKWKEQIGYEDHEIGDDFAEWQNRVHPDDLEATLKKVRKSIEQKRPNHAVEFRFRHKDGSYRWILAQASIYHDKTGRPVRMLGAHIDVTDRKKAERESLIFKTAIDQAPVGIALADENIQIYYCNPEGLGMRGGNTHDLVRIPKDAFANWQVLMLNGEPYENDKLPLVRAISKGETVREEFIVRHQDGSDHICDASAYPIHEGGAIIGGMVIFLDVTEQKRVEQRVEHLNRVLRAIRDVNQLIVREHDAKTLINEGCRLMVHNRGYASALIILTDEENRLTTWAASGIASFSNELSAMLDRRQQTPCCDLARKATNVIVIDERSDVCGSCPIVGESGQSTSLCTRLTHGDRTFGYLIAAVDTNIGVEAEELSLFSEMAGDLAYALNFIQLGTDHEISEHKRETLEHQLFQAQKMEAVGNLAGGVAHDYNNMLSIIIGYAESALEKLALEDPLYDDITEILKAGKRSSDITRQLLAFARQQTTAPKVLDLNDNIEGMLKMLRRLIGEDIDLAWLPGAGVWPVKVDPSQIDQILANLCVNARDAIKGVGQITIETKNVRFDEEYCADHAGFAPGDYVTLAVSDNGSGMAPETREKVFEPFFTTKKLHQGTGLGLSTVYGIVKQNNGFVNVYSELEKGTTLKIYFPRYVGEIADVRRETAQEIPVGQGETILLVEDDASILKLGEKMLKSLGYSVLSASTPNEAFAMAEKHADEIHLMVTDVVMPEMNGRELSEALQKQYPSLKTLFMSGYTANVIAHRGVLEEGVHFIPKPLSKKDLAKKVRAALDSAW